MSEKYIPTTDEVRDHYDPSCEPRFQDDDRLEKHIPAEFDRWLAAHDARVRRKALELSDEEFQWLIDNAWGGQEIWNEDGVGNLIKDAFFSLSKRREASDVRA